MTNRPGSRAAATFARPRPSHSPTAAKASTAAGSPSRAAAVTVGPLMSSTRPRASSSMRCPRKGSVPAISRASRTSALPLQYCSQQPRRPQPQRWPSGTSCICPNSAAIPKPPRYSDPPATMPPPMPVPIVTQMRSGEPRPAPNRCSAHAVALPSFSTTIGRSIRAARSARSGSSRHGTFGAKYTLARPRSIQPAAPIPTVSTAG